ncbi:MAG TPA: chemotaxis protein CheB [Solirubrobacteraceae bacterium]|nr:chemotaxis protein CheB [Solirubrobacteraceae bacterium]
MPRAWQIVVCDGSATRAQALVRFLERDPELKVAGSFAGIASMVARLGELSPDLITIDVATVGVDVPAAIESVRREGPTPVLILGNGVAAGDVRVRAALDAGALEAIGGDRLDLAQPDGVWAKALRSRIKRLASHHSGRRAAEPAPRSTPPRASERLGASYRAIGIGASVGGPPALATVLGALPAEFPLPVLVVQHMALGFGESLAFWLDRTVAIPVGLAVDGEPLRPGAWLAPDGVHLRLTRTQRLSLDGTTERGAHRPSLDVLLESLAESVGTEAVGVVLTGMGRDGAEGVRAIGATGGLTIAQDEESSVVFGMPAAAIKAGVAEVLPLDGVGPRLAALRVWGETA